MPLWKAKEYQRTVERAIKDTKRQLVVLDEALKNAKTDELKAELGNAFSSKSVLLKKQEARLKDFCKQTGIYYDNSRLQIFTQATENGIKNWGKSVSSKAVWAFEKQKLPNYRKAIMPDEKFVDYALNKKHPTGKHKAIAFEKYLGYNINNKDILVEEIRKGLTQNISKKRPDTEHGKPYEVRMLISGANGKKAHIKTGWIFDKDSDAPRLTSVYVDEK